MSCDARLANHRYPWIYAQTFSECANVAIHDHVRVRGSNVTPRRCFKKHLTVLQVDAGVRWKALRDHLPNIIGHSARILGFREVSQRFPFRASAGRLAEESLLATPFSAVLPTFIPNVQVISADPKGETSQATP
jgi:hypothetical protein